LWYAPVLGNRIPIDFGTLGDYDSVGFSILHFRALNEPTPPPIPETIPINPLDGEITSISIPEPGITSIVGVVLILAAMRTRQHSRSLHAPPADMNESDSSQRNLKITLISKIL
jgi:hypothetical protein